MASSEQNTQGNRFLTLNEIIEIAPKLSLDRLEILIKNVVGEWVKNIQARTENVPDDVRMEMEDELVRLLNTQVRNLLADNVINADVVLLNNKFKDLQNEFNNFSNESRQRERNLSSDVSTLQASCDNNLPFLKVKVTDMESEVSKLNTRLDDIKPSAELLAITARHFDGTANQLRSDMEKLVTKESLQLNLLNATAVLPLRKELWGGVLTVIVGIASLIGLVYWALQNQYTSSQAQFDSAVKRMERMEAKQDKILDQLEKSSVK